MFSSSERLKHEDQKIENNISDANLSNRLFMRVSAKGIHFKKVDFKYGIFDGCYFRKCTFESCDFTGSKFKETNLHGTVFDGCKFDYSLFERTFVDDNILSTGCPGFENLKLRFARALRVNYQQIGDYDAVNKAIKVELDATGVYLFKAWHSNESYYRKEYRRGKRFKYFVKWLSFWCLEAIWGNGENVLGLLRAIGIIFILIAISYVFILGDKRSLLDYWYALGIAPSIFLGVLMPPEYPKLIVSFIVLARLIMVGFFLSIVIKRFNRR